MTDDPRLVRKDLPDYEATIDATVEFLEAWSQSEDNNTKRYVAVRIYPLPDGQWRFAGEVITTEDKGIVIGLDQALDKDHGRHD